MEMKKQADDETMGAARSSTKILKRMLSCASARAADELKDKIAMFATKVPTRTPPVSTLATP